MTEKLTVRQYLTDKGLLQKFLYNTEQFNFDFNDVIDSLETCDADEISSYFIFSRTPEGMDYWMGVKYDYLRVAHGAMTLIEFLFTKDLYDTVLQRIELCGILKSKKEVKKALNSIEFSVSDLFVWSETPEGFDYWLGIDNEFKVGNSMLTLEEEAELIEFSRRIDEESQEDY